MSQINTNVNSLIAQRILTQQNVQLNQSLERLSTGLRINRGGDDPAGLIASETLRSEKKAIEAAIGNAERADQIVNIAEGGLQEVNTLLLELQSLVSQTANEAGLSQEEKEANQQQVDNILQTIDLIASTTSFQGSKLLNGSFDFQVSAQATEVVDFQVNAAKLGSDNLIVQAAVTESAQHAGLFLSVGGTALDLSTTNPSFVIDVAGALGARQFSFASGAATSAIAAQINTFSDTVGVSATVSGDGIVVKSTEFGSNQFVSIDVVSHGDQDGTIVQLSAGNENVLDTGAATALSAVLEPIRDDGQDIDGTINGVAATGRGTRLSVNSDALAVDVLLNSAGYQSTGAIDLFTITGGGATFNLGPSVDLGNQVRLGIGNVAARELGTTEIDNPDDDTSGRFPTARVSLDELGSGRLLNLVDGDLTAAQNVVDTAVKEVSTLRGRLGSFQKNVVGSTINSLNVALENVSAAESAIRDTDFASETANLTRSQILVAAATDVLGIANAQPQSVLALLA